MNYYQITVNLILDRGLGNEDWNALGEVVIPNVPGKDEEEAKENAEYLIFNNMGYIGDMKVNNNMTKGKKKT